MKSEQSIIWNPIPELEAPKKPRTQTPNFSYEWRSKSDRNQKIEAQVREMLNIATIYLLNILENDFTFPNPLPIILSDRTKHAQGGTEGIYIAIKRLKEENPSQYQKDREQSLIIHEFVHDFDETETLPMMIELAYMLEKGHTERLSEITTLIGQGKFPPIYLNGLTEVAKALGYETNIEFLHGVSINDAERLKAIFAEKMQEKIANTKSQSL